MTVLADSVRGTDESSRVLGSPMKILWIPHMAWPALDGQRERRMLSHWPDAGDELHVLTWLPARGFGNRLASLGKSTFKEGNLVVHCFPRVPNVVGRFAQNYARGLWANEVLFRSYARRLIKDLGIDVLVYGLSHKLIGLPPFDVAIPRVFDYLDLCTYPEVESEYLRNSDLVLCTSTVLAERATRAGARAAYLPNGVDMSAMAGGNRDRTRARLGLSRKQVVSLIGLTYDPSLFFIDALAVAARSIPDLVLLLVGGGVAKGDLARPIVERCHRLGVEVVAVGRVPSSDVPDFFAASDVGLYPGGRDAYFDAACPIKVLEYTAARRPVVATELAELARMAFPNVRLVHPDPAVFGAAVVASFREPTTFPDLSRFDWARLASDARGLCLDLVGRRR